MGLPFQSTLRSMPEPVAGQLHDAWPLVLVWWPIRQRHKPASEAVPVSKYRCTALVPHDWHNVLPSPIPLPPTERSVKGQQWHGPALPPPPALHEACKLEYPSQHMHLCLSAYEVPKRL